MPNTSFLGWKFQNKTDTHGPLNELREISSKSFHLEAQPQIQLFTIIGIIDRLADGQQVPAKEHEILSRTQMMIPRRSELTVFTVRGIIERLAMGQQVPAKESMKYEMLRFCTFRQYPPSGKPSTIRLAKAGFYYATNRDEVICYCCAKRISNWKENDDPMLAHKHVTPNCDFLLKNSEVNIPISITDESDVIQRLQRLETDPVFINQVFNETSTEALKRRNNLLTDAIRTDAPTDDDRSNIGATSNMLRANSDSAVAKDSIPAGSFAKTGLNSLPPVGAENREDSDRPYMSLVGYDVNNAAAVLTVKKMENMTGIMMSNINRLPDFVNTKPVQPTDDSSTDLTRGMSSSSNTASNNSPSTTAISAISQSIITTQAPSTVTTTLLPRSSQTQIPTSAVTVNSAAVPSKYPKHSTRAARIARFRKSHRIAASEKSSVSNTDCCGASTDTILPKVTQDQCRINQTGVTVQPQTVSCSERTPQYPEYITQASRIASFGHTEHIAVRIKKLCDAGFFYLGSGDATRCFYCGIGLGNWSPDDDPMFMHAWVSNTCPFVLASKNGTMK